MNTLQFSTRLKPVATKFLPKERGQDVGIPWRLFRRQAGDSTSLQ
jgi:hypothetical protein